jgi:UDP-N-acetyl-D-mannosaminuronate dehydrogenase
MQAVDAGFDVVGFDTDEDRVKSLSAGESCWRTRSHRHGVT